MSKGQVRVIVSRGYMCFVDDSSCGSHYRGHIGVDMFHNHLPALALAIWANREAGKKVKRVAVAKKHFMVVDV